MNPPLFARRGDVKLGQQPHELRILLIKTFTLARNSAELDRIYLWLVDSSQILRLIESALGLTNGALA